jgi:hypothetical protein
MEFKLKDKYYLLSILCFSLACGLALFYYGFDHPPGLESYVGITALYLGEVFAFVSACKAIGNGLSRALTLIKRLIKHA